MKKYLPVIVVVVLVAVGAGLILARDSEKAPAAGESQTSSHEDMDSTGNQATEPASEDSDQAVSTNSVTISDFAFSPASITVKKGTTVTWTNQDSVAHTVTSDSGNMLDSPLFSEGETFSFTFNQTGTFTYHCTPHPQMKGTVVVTQ